MFSGHSLVVGAHRQIAEEPGERTLGLELNKPEPGKMDLALGRKDLALDRKELGLHKTALGYRKIAEVLRSWTWVSWLLGRHSWTWVS